MSQHSNAILSPPRLDALRASGLLTSPPEEAFDRFTRMTASMLRVPVALISLVDKDRQVFKSQLGLPEPVATERQTPLSHSFCQHVVDTVQPLVVTDARVNPIVSTNLAIRDLGVIAYAGVPIRDGDGFVLGSLCAIDNKPRNWTEQDVEVLKSLSAQITVELQLRAQNILLIAALDKHKALETDRNQMARLNVHDLRTPLTALVMGMQIIKRLGPMNEAQTKYLEMCIQNGNVLKELIDSLLDIGSIDHRGADGLVRETCNATDAITQAIDQVRTIAQEKKIHVRTEITDALTPLSADSDKLSRVFVNLLANAIKFTNDGGYVTISATTCDSSERSCTQFCISDTGIGMADTSKIFNDGVKLNSNAPTRDSAGIGLTFCKRIVEAHGGTIWVESQPGIGSRFYFTIPLA